MAEYDDIELSEAQLKAYQEREEQRQKASNALALQTTRDYLSNVSSPLERKKLESWYTLEQKQQLLEDNTVDKYHGMDGFQKVRLTRSPNGRRPDGDSGWVTDKDGNVHEYRLSSNSSTYIDTPDTLRGIQGSSYKSRTQPEAVARASGKRVDQLTEFDFANYDTYAQNEFVKRATSKDGYKPERYDPTKTYSEIDVDGLEVYARFEGEDSTSSKRKLATIINPYTGEDVGYSSSLDPNVNTAFSLFRSLRNRSNALKGYAAQRRGEYYRDALDLSNKYFDPAANVKRFYEEQGDRLESDDLVTGNLKTFASSGLNMLGNMGVALNDTLGGQEYDPSKWDIRKYADKDISNLAVGTRKANRDEYNEYMQHLTSRMENGDILGGLKEFFSSPTKVSTFIAEQLGNMAPGLLATAATGGAGAASFGAATATDLLANIGMDFMEFRKNHGRSMNASEMAEAYVRQLPAALLDALSDKVLVGNSNVLKTAKYTPLRAAGEVAKEMGVEGTQEVTQNIASLMNSEDKSFDEALKDSSNISNFMLGALGGGLMSGPVGAGQVTRHMVKSAAFQQFKQKYEAKFDQQAADAGDTLAADHRQQRENFISSTLDNYQQAKSAGDSTAMFGSITSLKAKLDDAQSGLSAYDKEHIKSTLYDVVNDTISNLVKSGAMDSATESVLNQLKDSLGIQDNEQLKRDLAKYAEVYGSAANGRLATQNDTYENDHDRQVKAEQFETLIENLGGTKAEARKLLEEVAEENITSKTEGFDSYLAAAKKASEEGDTHTFEGKVSDMSDRIESMAIKHGKLVNGLKDEMNKGAAVDSKGMLSNDKIHIKYGFDKNAAKRGEEVSFDTSFKKEAFNYSTRGGIYRTADQISSEVQYMAEQLNSLEGVSQETKDKVNAFVSQVKQNDDLLEHLGYELHRGIKGGAKFNAEQESDVELSKERHAEIKEAMESYFNQYIAPRSASEKLTAKEAYQLKKYVSGLSLSELKSFQKSLDPKEDSIAYEGVSVVVKNRERNIGIASSHDAWLKANRVNGKYNAAVVQQSQAQAQSQPKPQAKPQEKPSTAKDLKITKSKIDKATDIDELIESGAYIDNVITTISDPSHKDYKNKSLMRKLKSIKKAIAERIAKLEAQNASELPQNGSESTETGQGEQSTTETQKASQNGSEGANLGSQTKVLNVWHATGENANLSNLALRPFDYEGKHYQSVEHAYQTLKSGSFDEAVYNNPRWNSAGTKIQGRKGTDKKTNLQLMKNLILESFKQNDSAKEELLATGNAQFTHKKPKGSNGIWETEFPRILEEIREELKDYQSETDNSEELNAEEEILSVIDKYSSEPDKSMSSEEIKAILNNINLAIDYIQRYPDNAAITRHADELQDILNTYQELYDKVLKQEAEESNHIEAVPLIDRINNILSLYGTPKEGLSSAEYSSIYAGLDALMSEIIKTDFTSLRSYMSTISDLAAVYDDLYYQALNKEKEAGNAEGTFEYEHDTLEALLDKLINAPKNSDFVFEEDEAVREAKENEKITEKTNPEGRKLLKQWRKNDKMETFANAEGIEDIRKIFSIKEASMTLEGLNDEAKEELISKAVKLLSETVVQFEEIPRYGKKDKDSGKPDPRTLAKRNKDGSYSVIATYNKILSNMFNHNPHLQLLYAPDKISSFTPNKIQIAEGKKGFTNVYSTKMNERVAAALLLAVSEFFANRSVASMLNPQSRDEIAAAFGTTSEAANPMDLETYTRVAESWGVFKKNICATLGRLVMDNLGLRRGTGLDDELSMTYANAEAALGNLALVMAEQMKWVAVTDVWVGEEPKREDFKSNEDYNREKARYDRCSKLESIGLTKADAINLGLGTSSVRHFYKFNDNEDVNEQIKALWLGERTDRDEENNPLVTNGPIERNEAMGLKQFKTGADTLTRTPLLSPNDVHNSSTRRKQPGFKLTDKRMEVLNKESKAPYYINLPILDSLLEICDGDITKLRSNLLKRMGFNNIINDHAKFSKLSYDEQQKIKGKNQSLVRELDYLLAYARLQKLLSEKGKFNGFFFRYFGSANGRSFMDTNTMNPQTAKSFTRFMVQPETTNQEYDLNNREDIECELFAVAQAFDCLKSMYRTKDISSLNGVSLAGKLLGLDVVNKNVKNIEKRLQLLKEMKTDLLMNDKEMNKKIYKDIIEWEGDVENFGQAVVALDHCIHRLETILDNNGFTEGAKKLKSYLAVENDSTTSGYVIKFLLMPLSSDLLKDYGPKVGFLNHRLIDNNDNFTPEFKEKLKSYKSIDELKADPDFLDIYKTAAVEMLHFFEKIEKDVTATHTMGDIVYENTCLDKHGILMPIGQHLVNSNLEAKDIDKGFSVIRKAIPHPKALDEKKTRWEVSSILRNLMKPIVMIFGYNASADSCRKRFAEAVMEEHVKDFLKLWWNEGINYIRAKGKSPSIVELNEKGKEMFGNKSENIARVEAIFNFMKDMAFKVTGETDSYLAMEKFVKMLSEKSPYAIRFKAEEGVSPNETLSIVEWYQLTIGSTYGQAVTDFMFDKFREYGDANQELNNVSKSIFYIYNHIRTELIKKNLSEIAKLDTGTADKPCTNPRIQSLRSKHVKELKNAAAEIRKSNPNFNGYVPLTGDMLNQTDLTKRELDTILKIADNVLPKFPMPEGEHRFDTNIRSVETKSRNLEGSSAYTEMWPKDANGNYQPGFRHYKDSDKYRKVDYESLNSYGDVTEYSIGERILAVLLIHFTDGVIAEGTMDHMLSDNPELNRFLTVVHDAFVVSAKDSKRVGQGFNKKLMTTCTGFNPFQAVLYTMLGNNLPPKAKGEKWIKNDKTNGILNIANNLCNKYGIPAPDFKRKLKSKRTGQDIPGTSFFNLCFAMERRMNTVFSLRQECLLGNPVGSVSPDTIVVANLGGDVGGEYVASGRANVPVSGTEMSTPTAKEKASIQEGDALGSRAAAWKDGYTIERIEKDANTTAEGRDRLVNSLNEYDELEGPVKNTSEFVEHVKSFLSILNPERLRELSFELTKSKKDAATKGVYFTGQGQSGNRRITVIKAKDIANEADRQRRLASRQVSAVSVYGHEVIHAAVSEPLANAEIYGVTRERSALQKFQNAVADKLHELHGEHPENFFRPDNYDFLTDAEKALADQSALDFYNYMFANPDPDAMGGLQEFVAYATTDPRMIELLKSMDASQYSAEYKGKNLFEKLCYIVKHIIKAAFGNLESRQKVINTYTSLGNNPKKAVNMHEAIEQLLVKLSYANKDAASKLGNGKLSQFEHMFEALNSAMQLAKPVNDYLSNKIKWVFDLGGVANRFERTYKSFEQIIREHGITENSSKMDTLKTLLLCPFSHNMRVALIDTLIGCCEQGQRSTFAHLIRDVSDKDDATAKIEALSAKQNLIDQTSRNAGAATSAYIQQEFGGKLTDAEAVAGTKIGLGCDLQCLFFNGYSIADIKKLAAGEGIEEAIAKHEDAIRQFYANDKDGKMKFTWTRNQCLGLAHFMNTNKGNPALCLNARNIAKGILCSKRNAEVNEDLVNHIDCLATLHALANAEPEHRLALSTMKPEGLKAILQCHRNLIDSTREGEYIEEAHVIKGWHASLIDDTRAYAVAPVDPDIIKAMENDGYALYEDKALPVDNMTDAVMGFYIKDANTPQHRQGAALQITSKRAIGQSLNSFMEANEHIIGDRKDYIRKQTKKAFAFKDRMQSKMESLADLKYEDFDTRKLIGSYYTPVINPKGDVVDFRITMFNDFKDVAMHRNNNVCDVLSKMEAVNVVKRSAGTHNSKIVHFLVDDMEKNMDPDTHRLKHQYENFGEVALGSRDLRHKHDIKYVKLQLDPESEFVAPDIPAAILPSEMKMAMKKLDKKGDGLWVREDWLYQIFGTPEMSLADFDVMQKENMRAARNGIRIAENVIKGIATLAKVAIVFKKPAVIAGNCVSNYMFHLINGHNPVTAAAMDTENLQLLTRYMQLQKEVNVLDLKKDIGEATDYEKAKLTRYRAEMENSPVHELVQEGLFSAIVEDNSKKDQDSIKFMIRKIKENPIMQKAIKTKFGDAVNMDTLLGQATGQIWMREGTPIYDFIYTMTQYSDFVSRLTDYRIGMANMRKNKAIADNPTLASRYRELLIQQIRDDYINYDIPQSKLMNYVNAMGITFFTKYFFRIQRVIRRIATRRPLMTFAMFAGKAHFDLPDNIFNQSVVSKKYSVIPRGLVENVEEAVKPQLFEIIEHPFDWLNSF